MLQSIPQVSPEYLSINCNSLTFKCYNLRNERLSALEEVLLYVVRLPSYYNCSVACVAVSCRGFEERVICTRAQHRVGI